MGNWPNLSKGGGGWYPPFGQIPNYFPFLLLLKGSLRTRMERFGENFRAGNSPVICPLCKLHFDSQELSLQCPEIRKELEIKAGNYEEIYKDNIESSNIVKTLVEITEIRKLRLRK